MQLLPELFALLGMAGCTGFSIWAVDLINSEHPSLGKLTTKIIASLLGLAFSVVLVLAYILFYKFP